VLACLGRRHDLLDVDVRGRAHEDRVHVSPGDDLAPVGNHRHAEVAAGGVCDPHVGLRQGDDA
jgi:hypothetical protein